MLYLLLNVFFLDYNANSTYLSRQNELEISELAVMVTEDDANTLIEEYVDFLPNLMVMILSQSATTANIYKELQCNSAKRNISGIFNILHSYLIIIKMVFDVLKEVKEDELFDLDITNGICLCSDSKFCSRFTVSLDGFDKLFNFIAILKKGFEKSKDLSPLLTESLLAECKLVLEYYFFYEECLIKYYNHIYGFVIEESISVKKAEYARFLQFKFCCAINVLEKFLDSILMSCKIWHITIEGLDLEINVANYVRYDYFFNPSNAKIDRIDKHIKEKIDIYYVLKMSKLSLEMYIQCYGSCINQKSKEYDLSKLYAQEVDSGKTLLDRFSVENCLEFLPKEGLKALDIVYDQYLVKRLTFFVALHEKIVDENIDDITLNSFIFLESISLLDSLKKRETTKLLKLIYRGIFFVQEYVYSDKKTNFNIFLGTVFNRLRVLVVQLDEESLLDYIRNLSIVISQVNNSEDRLKNRKLSQKYLLNAIKSYRFFIRLIDLLNRGWLKEKEIDICSETSTRQKIEKEIIEFLNAINI